MMGTLGRRRTHSKEKGRDEMLELVYFLLFILPVTALQRMMLSVFRVDLRSLNLCGKALIDIP